MRTHHAAAQEHGLSQLPIKSLSEFQKAGGKLSGGTQSTHEEYDGPPRQYNSKLATTFDKLGMGGSSTGQQSSTGGTETGTHAGAGAGARTGAGAGLAAGGVGAAAAHHRRGSASSSSSSDESVGGTRRKKNRLGRAAAGTGLAGNTGTGTSLDSGPQSSSKVGGSHTASGIGNSVGNSVGSNSQPLGSTGTPTSRATGEQKPGLMDRLNPRVDADRDGKAGLGD